MNIVDWGLIDYEEAWQRQREIAASIESADEPDTLVLCEHPSVITLGRTTQTGAVLTTTELLRSRGVMVVENDRGGEATVHNPGQLVGYPIFNLQRTRPDLHWFLRSIEQVIIESLADFELESHRVEGLTGVWVGGDKKVCAIGIHCRKWITTHGFALNVTNDLTLFDDIIPCGIKDKKVTSLAREVTFSVAMSDVKEVVGDRFQHWYFQSGEWRG